MTISQAATVLPRHETDSRAQPVIDVVSRLDVVGSVATRYGVVGVIAWIGAMKFTAYEANAIQGLVANSPFMAWVYNVFSVEGFGTTLGIIELGIAFLLALKPVSAKAAAIGAALAIGMFAATLSFVFSTPGVFETSLGGFPALSVMPGQFLIKDMALLGVSVWLLADALKAIARRRG